jgi:biotin carboxyl carrier protein
MGWALGKDATMKYVTTIGEREFMVEILDEGQVLVDGQLYHVDFEAIGDQPLYSLLLDGKSYEAYVYPADREASDKKTWQVLLQGHSYPALVEDERDKRLHMAAGAGVGEGVEFYLKAPMPGLVVAVPVVEGQDVRRGDVLAILESMKMQNELKSPRSGVVTRLRVEVNDRVEQNQTMMSVV